MNLRGSVSEGEGGGGWGGMRVGGGGQGWAGVWWGKGVRPTHWQLCQAKQQLRRSVPGPVPHVVETKEAGGLPMCQPPRCLTSGVVKHREEPGGGSSSRIAVGQSSGSGRFLAGCRHLNSAPASWCFELSAPRTTQRHARTHGRPQATHFWSTNFFMRWLVSARNPGRSR